MLAVKRFLNLRRGRIDVRKEVKKQLRIQKRLQNDIYKKLQTLYRTQIKKVSHEYKINQSFEPTFFVRETTALTETVMRQHYKKVFTVVYNNNEETYDRARKQDEVFVFGRSVEFEGLIDNYFKTRTPYFSNVPNEVAKSIQNQIQEGRLNNLTLDQISRDITKTNRIGRSRSALIARTETHNAASFANHQYHKTAYKDLGIEMFKRWAATGDLRTRSAHLQANGQTVPMDDNFLVGGAEMGYAGDPKGGAKNVINCRCVILYVDSEELENVIEEEEVINASDFGETSFEEYEYHKNADWQGESAILTSIRQAAPVNVKTKRSRGAYYRDSERSITMSSSYDDAHTKVVWRHEYGHSIDNDKILKDRLVKASFVDEADALVINANRQMSVVASKEILKDRKVLTKKNNLAKKKMRKEVMDNPENTRIYRYKQEAYENLGLIKNSQGEFAALDKVLIEKRIRKYLEKTDGIFNTKFLDDLLGKEWSKNILKSLSDDITNPYYVERVLETVTNIKYNFATKNGNFIDDLMTLASRAKRGLQKNELLMFQDFIGSVTNNLVFSGHSASYYKKFPSLGTGITTAHGSEAFANYYALLGGKNSAYWRKILQLYVPETLKKFDDILKAIIDPID